MSAKLPNRSVISMASTYASAINFTSASNASECIISHASDPGYVVGDILEITSGWTLLNGKIARVKTVSTNDITLEGIDTTDTTLYPAGSGAGSARKITAFTQMSQITDSEMSGGDPKFISYEYLEDPTERQIQTGKSAKQLTLTFADDPSLALYALANAADEDGEWRALQVSLPGGGKIYYNGTVAFDDDPTLKKNEVMSVKFILSLVSKKTRYTS